MAEQKIVLVTGASSGIGAAIAARLTKDGHKVFGTGRNASGTTPDGVTMLALDVRSDDSVRACAAAVLSKAGRLDVLINNAGYLLAGAIEEATIAQAQDEFDTNFFGVVRMVKAVLPAMRKQRSGLIVNISSLAGIVPFPFWGFYNASKFAVEGYSESLRTDLKPFGIHVAMVEPGAIKTPLYAHPTTTPMPEYSPWRDRALKSMKHFESIAPGPEAVAAVVSKIVRSRSPRLRNGLTREGTILPILRRLVPEAIFEAALRSNFRLDKEGS